MKFTLSQIAQLLDAKIEGNDRVEIHAIQSLDQASSTSISFLANPKYEASLYHTQAAAVIVSKDFKPKKQLSCTLVRVPDPYLAFTTLLEAYQRMKSLQKTGLESPNHLGAGATHGKGLYLGAFAYVGDQVKIGENVKIYPHAYIGDGVTIGDHTIIYPGVKIYSNCKIGSYCTIQAGAIIGSHGFGFAPQADGSYKNIPQVGHVILEDHVDIGANTTVDCGTLDATIIHRGVKIDNLVQVAHNVEIGENTVIAAQTGISGSAKIGKQVVMGGQVGVQGHIKIADQTTIGAKSGVTKTVRKGGQTISGKFAYNNPDYLKSYALFRKLPALMQRIELLEQKILNLPAGKETHED